eukprot:m.78263 g.78263  ORF g.78263 m.78263 type:complete len:520 (-) comp25097_c0_seq3:107-1666(-)
MSSDYESNREEQLEEMEALEAICIEPGEFESSVLDNIPDFQGPIEGFLRCKPLCDDVQGVNVTLEVDNPQSFVVHHLPPIVLQFEFPPEYPSKLPPVFKLICEWLTEAQISQLKQALIQEWKAEPGEPVLFKWHSFLQTQGLETIFKDGNMITLTPPPRRQISNPTAAPKPANNLPNKNETQPKYCKFGDKCKKEGCRFVHEADGVNVQNQPSSNATPTGEQSAPKAKKVPPVLQIFRRLQEYDKAEIDRAFNSSHVLCNICFTEKLGKECIKFQCSHTFCRICISGYFKSQMDDGHVRSLICPDTSCKREAHQLEVRALLDGETYAKYERMQLEVTLAEMQDIVYCPRVPCQTPVIVEGESTYARCEKCFFGFCILCKRTWHGVSKCAINSHNAVVAAYNEGSPEKQKNMRNQYGKKLIEMIEEFHTNQYLSANSQQCPKCKASISKIDGCNKMVCSSCGTYFCWICNKTLDKQTPYAHFRGGSCGGRLFEGILNDPDDDDDGDDDEWLNWMAGFVDE